MIRRRGMPQPRKPIVVMPAVYALDEHRHWCRLKDVCIVARRLARIYKLDFPITPEELVRRFAALIRPNRPLTVPVDKRRPDGPRKSLPAKKFFRYSEDGHGFWGTEVLPRQKGESWFSSFRLNIETPYPKTMFVPQEWVADVFEAIRKGSVSTVDHGDDFVTGIKSDTDECGHVITLRKPELVSQIPS